jgi:hypothetical protein
MLMGAAVVVVVVATVVVVVVGATVVVVGAIVVVVVGASVVVVVVVLMVVVVGRSPHSSLLKPSPKIKKSREANVAESTSGLLLADASFCRKTAGVPCRTS